jgi:hypothetical protein
VAISPYGGIAFQIRSVADGAVLGVELFASLDLCPIVPLTGMERYRTRQYHAQSCNPLGSFHRHPFSSWICEAV